MRYDRAVWLGGKPYHAAWVVSVLINTHALAKTMSSDSKFRQPLIVAALAALFGLATRDASQIATAQEAAAQSPPPAGVRCRAPRSRQAARVLNFEF